MKMSIAVIVIGAGAFALAQTNLALAAYAGAAESRSALRITGDVSDPAIRLAQNVYLPKVEPPRTPPATTNTDKKKAKCDARPRSQKNAAPVVPLDCRPS
jgi:hypothetical protein